MHTAVALEGTGSKSVRHLPLAQLEATTAAANVAQNLRNCCVKSSTQLNTIQHGSTSAVHAAGIVRPSHTQDNTQGSGEKWKLVKARVTPYFNKVFAARQNLAECCAKCFACANRPLTPCCQPCCFGWCLTVLPTALRTLLLWLLPRVITTLLLTALPPFAKPVQPAANRAANQKNLLLWWRYWLVGAASEPLRLRVAGDRRWPAY